MDLDYYIDASIKNTQLPQSYIPKNEPEMVLLRYPSLEETGIVKHCFSTRFGGVSEGHLSSMNLSFSRGDDEKAVRENYRRLAHAMEADYEQFVFSDQTHTTNVRVVTPEDAGKGLVRERDYSDIDGLVTNVSGIVLATFYADCVPLYFVDPVHRAIGLSHSGWRGTVSRMGKVTLETMRENYGTDPSEVICAIGPSICQDCYEISRDVAEQFIAEFPDHQSEILIQRSQEKFYLNLWRTNEIILQEAGVPKENITCTNLCTCCNPKLLFSHRATSGKRGNLGAFLSLL